MQEFTFTSDLVERTEKPNRLEIGKISNELRHQVKASIEEFSKMIASGNSFCPAIFKDNVRSNENWLEQSMFSFDFDNGVEPKVILDRLSEYGIVPNIVYPSFSDSPDKRRFRIILILDEVVNDISLRDLIQKGMMLIMEDSDKSCKDPARMYFGGRSSEVLNKEFTPCSLVIASAEIAIVSDDQGKFRKLAKFETSILLYKSLKFSQNEDPSEDLGIKQDLVRDHTPLLNFTGGQDEKYPFDLGDNTRKEIDFKELEKECLIFKDFLGGVWLTHKQIFGLATALHWVVGGSKLMKDTMTKFNDEGKTEYNENNFTAVKYAKFRKYNPQSLSSYSPHEEDAELGDPLLAVWEPRGLVEVIEEIPKISLVEAEKLMKEKFQEALDDTSNDSIYLFKLPTGIGKTKMLESSTCTIALPTNALKDEVYDRVKTAKVKTPDFPKLADEDLDKKVRHLYKIGLSEVAVKIIKKISKGGKGYLAEDVDKVNIYLSTLRKSYVSNDCVVTTHTRAIHSDFKSGTIIFDEDPLNKLLQVKSFSISDLISLEAGGSKVISLLIDALRVLSRGVYTKTPSLVLDMEKLVMEVGTDVVSSDVISLINSNYIVRDERDPSRFHYICRQDLPKDKKIIIMSATVPDGIYSALYGDRVKVIDITNVEQVGKVVQNTKKSFSRSSLRSAGVNLLATIDVTLPTITFKEFISKIPNAKDNIYFGNVAGYDELKGLNINIVGTPHLNNIVYMLMAKICNIELKPTDFVMSFRKVKWGNFRFKFNCYHHPRLMDLQLSLIESELIQAVGRNRTLREDCTAFVYSNLPLTLATNFK